MKAVLTIFKKEMTELLRDKRVRSAAIFGPMFLVLMLMFLFGFLLNTLSDKKDVKIHIVNPDKQVVAGLKKAQFDVHVIGSDAEGRKMLQNGQARVVLMLAPDADAKLDRGEPIRVVGLFNPGEQISQIGLATVQQYFESQNKLARRAFLVKQGIAPDSIEPFQLDKVEVKEEGAKPTNEMLVQLLPYLMVLWAFYGGMSSSSELVAGEKEKNTLETLLISPVLRSQIAYGKFLALVSISLLGSLSCMVGMAIAPLLPFPGVSKLFEGGLGISPQAALTILVTVLPCAALFSSVMLAVSTFAKNPREAQTQLTLVSFIVLMPAMFSQFIGFTDYANAKWIAFVPILDSANTIRHALQGKFSTFEIGTTLALNCVLAAIAITIAIRLFQREEVLVRS